MRKNLSLVFFCLASVLILLQLMSSLMELMDDQSQNRVLHSVTNQIEKMAVVETQKKVDFKKIAQEMSEEKY